MSPVRTPWVEIDFPSLRAARPARGGAAQWLALVRSAAERGAPAAATSLKRAAVANAVSPELDFLMEAHNGRPPQSCAGGRISGGIWASGFVYLGDISAVLDNNESSWTPGRGQCWSSMPIPAIWCFALRLDGEYRLRHISTICACDESCSAWFAN